PYIGIYGATSFTASECLTYLCSHSEKDKFQLSLAGRTQSKLDKVVSDLNEKIETVVLLLTDEQGVKEWVKKCQVVINFAGPYALYNAEALIKACAEHGTHYVDVCGEAYFVAKMIERYHDTAKKTKTCIVPACGFDAVPSDLIVYLARQTLQNSHPSARLTKSTTFFSVRGTVSGGTIATLRSTLSLPPSQRGGSQWSLIPLTPPTSKTKWPTFAATEYVPGTKEKLYGAIFPFAPFDKAIVRRSWYFTLLNDEKDPEFRYEEYVKIGSVWLAWIVSLGVYVFFGLYFFVPLFRKLVDRFLPQPGQGATLEKRRKGWARLINVSHTTTNVKVITKLFAKGDPGYIATCYMCAESALSLVLPPPSGTSLPDIAHQGGVLTPMTALGDVLKERLKRNGVVEVESELV
ncbi:hypothetical protein TREMEDRAFT_22045, partial [Tremella mesenterica DSM 1558]|uniref:uncharacterized protein n=1 Tax=Tremella mesenterica (strain ATCC 24925 / CBS 8224 / DSM 1558 / NBRC 9311 / NRRL Y-6157 / RJB 2259-6 / UBC 559-6) TaxID=578456 RepID=UPI0003F498A0